MSSATICPNCQHTNIVYYYTLPPTIICLNCNKELYDRNYQGITILNNTEGRKRRPEFYGDPVCPCCSHAPHIGICDICENDSKGYIPDLIVKK